MLTASALFEYGTVVGAANKENNHRWCVRLTTGEIVWLAAYQISPKYRVLGKRVALNWMNSKAGGLFMVRKDPYERLLST